MTQRSVMPAASSASGGSSESSAPRRIQTLPGAAQVSAHARNASTKSHWL